MKASVSLCLNHAPFAHDRVPKLTRMADQLELRAGYGPRGPFWVHDVDYRKGGTIGKAERVDFSLNQWRWAVQQPTNYHAFATDDLELVPRFWEVLDAILEVVPNDVIGLLSNHPEAPALAAEHHRFYATNSWVVGPMYVIPHFMLTELLQWPGTLGFDAQYLGWSDDATINGWVRHAGPGRALHPLPTPIEHDPEGLMSTWGRGGGDEYSRERVSWRKLAAQAHLDEARLAEDMLDPAFWRHKGGADDPPMLRFPES
jgi:hypothetical protein